MTEEQLAKIRWLNRAFHAEKAARAWLAKLERDRALAERITRGTSDTHGSSGGNSTEDALLRLAQTEEETQARLRELVTIRDEITAAVKSLEDLDMQAILVRHYLAYEPWELVAEKMHYSVRSIKYKHKAALDKVCIELHPET